MRTPPIVHTMTLKKKSRGPHRDPLWTAACSCGLHSLPLVREAVEAFVDRHIGHHASAAVGAVVGGGASA